MKVLLVEDDMKLGKTIQELLIYEHCSVDWVQNGTDAEKTIKYGADFVYDVVILDWMLPGITGLDICKLLRNKYNFQGGIVFVTAKGELDDCVSALNFGADDYIIKPLKIKELIARLNAVCRRKGKPFIDKTYSRGTICINSCLNTITCQNTSITLRKKEFELFEMLFVNLNNLIPRKAIFEKIWSDKLETSEESLDSHVYTLRKKLKSFPKIQIKSVKNIGYKMEIAE